MRRENSGFKQTASQAARRPSVLSEFTGKVPSALSPDRVALVAGGSLKPVAPFYRRTSNGCEQRVQQVSLIAKWGCLEAQ